MTLAEQAGKRVEIERKWRLAKLPSEIEYSSYQEVPAVKIEQAYLVAEREVEFRLRRAGSQYFITRKRGNGFQREEKENKISQQTFWELVASLTEGNLIKKWRFRYKFNGHCLEFDQFEGDLAGLVLLEVEFESEEESSLFTLPEWVGDAEEVTGQLEYSNKMLALQGWPAEPLPLF